MRPGRAYTPNRGRRSTALSTTTHCERCEREITGQQARRVRGEILCQRCAPGGDDE